MSSYLFRLGRLTARRARTVVLAWVAVLVGVGALAGLAGGQLEDDLTIPGTEAQEGLDVLDTRFPELVGATGHTPGHLLLGLQVQTPAGRPAGFARAAVRSLLLCLVIPAVVFDPDQRGLHDKAMNTLLIRR